MSSAPTGEKSEPRLTQRFDMSGRPALHRWLAGIAALGVVLVVSLLLWGPEMGFPTDVGSRTSSDGTVVLNETVRDVTSRAIDDGFEWITREGGWFFDGVSTAVTFALVNIEGVLKWTPWPVVLFGLAAVAFTVGRWPLFSFTSLALIFVGMMGLWENAMDTVALMAVSVAVAVAIGLPLGVLGARSGLADSIMRPILDGMQTMPSFVYLLPGILFFGLGKPAGVFATIIYAVPPVIRLTNLGIRQVSSETIEAARAFGSSPLQILTKVQIPIALPTIMAGINQTTMMALAMVTIASLVAAGGLGDNVNRALQKNEPGNGLLAGLAIVFMAIIIDRLTQAVAGARQGPMSVG
jgi:glycine betaine/proline transport system permease protein